MSRAGRAALWIGGAVALLLIVWAVSLPFVIGALDQDLARTHAGEWHPSPLPGFDPIAFGTGGVGCAITGVSTTFSVDDRIHLVGDQVFGGGDVEIRLFGSDRDWYPGYPLTRHLDAEPTCVHDDLPRLPVGHYNLFISMDPGPLGTNRFGNEFDVRQ